MKSKEKLKITLSRIKSILLQKKYLKEQKKEDIIKLLQEYINNLKQIDLIYQEADIESFKYGTTSYPDNLYNDLLTYTNKIYALLLGYIDSLIDENNINKYNMFRNLIIKDYEETINISTNKIIKETLLSKPCYINLYNVFIELKNNNYPSKNVLDIIEVYIKGYKCDNIYQIEDIYDTYIELTKDLNEIRVKNRNKYQRLRKRC